MKKYIISLIIFATLEIALALYLTFWREHFWNAISTKQPLEFLEQLGIFTGVALVICLVAGLSGYVLNLTAIKWREKLNDKAFAVREQKTDCNLCVGTGITPSIISSAVPCIYCNGTGTKEIENVNQRIQEDCWTYPDLVLQIVFGGVKALFYIIVFSISLLLSFSGIYLAIFLSYSIVGTVLTHFIAKPLVKLNYEQQRCEATYRNNLTINNFNECVRIMLGMAKKQKHLTYFQQFYGQVGVVIPLIVIAPVYFLSDMTLGILMRFNSIGSTILENTSYGITSFGLINRLISCRKRLKEAKLI